MLWLDICLGCFCLWGGVSGYLNGWGRACRRLAALAATAVTAAVVSGDMKHFLTIHYPIDDAIKALVVRRMAVPVIGQVQYGSVLESIHLPEALRGAIAAQVPYIHASSISIIADLLTTVMMNALAFAAAAALWWGIFHLAVSFGLNPERKPLSQWGGLSAGIVMHALLAVLIAGAAAPFIWLSEIPRELFDTQQSIFLRWALQLFSDTGIWLS